MRKTDIEYWALNIIERVEKEQPVEDSRVELKSEWIDPIKAARRIAGHANAARGEVILWLIGLDEKKGLIGVDYNEFSSWFSKVESQFDGIIPESTSIHIPYKGKSVLAIIFETDRAPFVVKNSGGGSIQFEVPWRDGTSVRTANRTELLRILVPIQRLPNVEVLSGDLSVQDDSQNNVLLWNLTIHLYVASMLQAPLAIPFHECVGTLELEQYLAPTILTQFSLYPPPLSPYFSYSPNRTTRPQFDSLTIEGTSNELIIKGPGKFGLNAHATSLPFDRDISSSNANIKVNLRPVDSDLSILVKTDMTWNEEGLSDAHNFLGLWSVNKKNIFDKKDF